MLLKEWKELWGIPLEDIKRQGIKYKIYSLFVYILDIMMILICGAYMYRKGSSFNICVFVTILITLVSFMLLNIVVNPEKWRAYLFYKKYKNLKVIETTLYLQVDNMKSILYCSNYKRKKLNGSISDYKELMLSACREDSIFAKRLGNLLSKFIVNEDNMIEIDTYLVKKGRKYFLIGFKDEEDTKENLE